MLFSIASILAVTTLATAAPSVERRQAAAAATVKSVAGWSAAGCWADGVYGKAYGGGTQLKSDGTVDGCLAACSAAGYAICGLEYQGECYGGKSLSRWSTPISTTKCSTKCKNDATSICGGSNALTLYIANSGYVAPTPNEALTYYDGYAYQGCYSDNVKPAGSTQSVRVLSSAAQPNELTYTVEGCLDLCKRKGAVWCGLEYYGECRYSTKDDLNALSQPVDESLCRYSCKNAPGQTCGGGSSLALYKVAPSPCEAR
ncbi:hypothetical protein JCM10207_004950 [Rhodosporidiobolus poonsookiae]